MLTVPGYSLHSDRYSNDMSTGSGTVGPENKLNIKSKRSKVQQRDWAAAHDILGVPEQRLANHKSVRTCKPQVIPEITPDAYIPVAYDRNTQILLEAFDLSKISCPLPAASGRNGTSMERDPRCSDMLQLPRELYRHGCWLTKTELGRYGHGKRVVH